MSKVPKEVTILMNTAFQLNLFKNQDNYVILFDSFMDKFEKQKVLFEYIYERVKQNMFDMKAIPDQVKEFNRLIRLHSIEQEFNNELKNNLPCLES
jgi:hypothetical protein